jgi:hypothetical protein
VNCELPPAIAQQGRRKGTTKVESPAKGEVGYTPINSEERNLFFRFIVNRYEKACTIKTSNKAFSEWTEIFHDTVIVGDPG